MLRSIRTSTPFGSPVVPPVYDSQTSSSLRVTRLAGSWPATRSS